ncbi:hypothetical protein CLOSYM_02947 [[Clostridium] symbiosum ATCC 14940]|uniref:Uncharacterized protein n=1 Tax=[Clostridium] symbiosum ATCC 14940 TaxID=411472 RepID=A0ABC9TW70_CLOSY|nr:hypothetical protein CLOSYM_02947 [[Clostridium] symbiosum ATCC 14940]
MKHIVLPEYSHIFSHHAPSRHDVNSSYKVTVHTVVFREAFSCVFCTKIPSYTARRFLAGCEQ